jgi:hypothetical protein
MASPKVEESIEKKSDFHQIDQPKIDRTDPGNTSGVKSKVESKDHSRLYLKYDTFILCNPNAMNY